VRSGSESRLLVARLEGDDAPGDVIDVLEGDPSLSVSNVAAAELYGAPGIRVDVEAASGTKLRVYAVDVDGRTVVLAVDAATAISRQGLQLSASDS
jgi:hypothetical protein